MLPKWAMGLWQSASIIILRMKFYPRVKEFRNRQIPLDNIVQDWFYWKEDQWGSHEFDSGPLP